MFDYNEYIWASIKFTQQHLDASLSNFGY